MCMSMIMSMRMSMWVCLFAGTFVESFVYACICLTVCMCVYDFGSMRVYAYVTCVYSCVLASMSMCICSSHYMDLVFFAFSVNAYEYLLFILLPLFILLWSFVPY